MAHTRATLTPEHHGGTYWRNSIPTNPAAGDPAKLLRVVREAMAVHRVHGDTGTSAMVSTAAGTYISTAAAIYPDIRYTAVNPDG